MATKSTQHESGFEKAVDRVRDNVKEFASSAGETVADGVGSLADHGADGVKAVARTVPQTAHWADEKLDEAREAIREKPIKMMAIAAGVGAVLGLILLRR